MKRIAQIVSILALAGTLLPAMLFFYDRMNLPAVKTWMIIPTVLWFISAPLWMEHKVKD